MRQLFLALLLAAPASAQTIEITSVFGRANVRQGQSVPMGSAIRAGAGGSVRGRYAPQGMQFQQNPSSSLTLASSGRCRTGAREGRVSEWQVTGIVFMQFPKRFFVRCSRAEIRTPQATYRIGGTEFRLNEGDQKTILAVKSGVVSVSALNREVFVPEGYFQRTRAGYYPELPQPYDRELRYEVLAISAGRALVRTSSGNEIAVGAKSYGEEGWIPLWATAEIRNPAGDRRTFTVRLERLIGKRGGG
jgi:hypothetical protein